MLYEKLEDSKLVRLFQEGNNEAFKTLLSRYQDTIFTYIYSQVRDEDDANDIFQETFVKVISSLRENRYNEKGKFIGWVMRIAHNLIIDHFRKDNKNQVIPGENEEYNLFNVIRFSDTKNVENKIIDTQIRNKVKSLIDLLPEEQKEIVILRHFVGMNFKEIAEELDISINTALGRMRYALINLRKIIKKYNIDLYKV